MGGCRLRGEESVVGLGTEHLSSVFFFFFCSSDFVVLGAQTPLLA